MMRSSSVFRRQFEVLLPDFEPKEQLAVNARRGRASCDGLSGDASAINKLVRTWRLCTDTNWPLAADAVRLRRREHSVDVGVYTQ